MILSETSSTKKSPLTLKKIKSTGDKNESFGSILNFFLTSQDMISRRKKKKILSGVLAPCRLWLSSKKFCKYKLKMESKDVPLVFKGTTEKFVNKYLWDDVKVIGKFDEFDEIFRVDKIYSVFEGEDFEISEILGDKDSDFESLRRKINQYGKIDPLPEVEAS